MRACVQRVVRASVRVADEIVGAIDQGFVVLLGVAASDDQADVDYLCDRICGLRIFEDEQGKMNRSLRDVGGSLLVVSQFTLLGDCRRGRQQSFIQAAPPERARELYDAFVDAAHSHGFTVATGRFRTSMQVELVNDGPVTLWLDSELRSTGSA